MNDLNSLVSSLRYGVKIFPRRWSGDTYSDRECGCVDDKATDAIMRQAADEIDRLRSAQAPGPGISKVEQERKRFEEWISASPMEYDTARNPYDESRYAWPGQYRVFRVQTAWESWCQALGLDPYERPNAQADL